MLPKKLLIICSIFLSGCCTNKPMPEKPTVEMCFLEVMEPVTESYCLCGMTNSDPAPKEELLKTMTDLVTHDLKYCDKATLFRVDPWRQIQNWIDALKAWGSE
jgi:hypothetical protein